MDVDDVNEDNGTSVTTSVDFNTEGANSALTEIFQAWANDTSILDRIAHYLYLHYVHHYNFKDGESLFEDIRDYRCLYAPSGSSKLLWFGKLYTQEIECTTEEDVKVKKKKVVSSWMSEIKKRLTNFWDSDARKYYTFLEKNNRKRYFNSSDGMVRLQLHMQKPDVFQNYYHSSRSSTIVDFKEYIEHVPIFDCFIHQSALEKHEFNTPG